MGPTQWEYELKTEKLFDLNQNIWTDTQLKY